ncbi:MAG: metal ABC transporter substrate-binding protein [Clostridiales bacterium]|nr:metal ABC transporter substrate-binding protein [Clostridiales bacterium]
MRRKIKNRAVLFLLVLLLGTGSIGLVGCNRQTDTGVISEETSDMRGETGSLSDETNTNIEGEVDDISEETDAESTGKDTFQIVTSFYPLYIMMLNIADGVPGVELRNMADPQTGCLHDYQLRPADLVSIEGADMFLANGGGMEDFLTDVLEAYPALTIVYALDGVGEDALLAGDEHDHEDSEDSDDHDYDDKQEDINPHTWLDPAFYKQELVYVTSMLGKFDEEHAELYEQNLAGYIARIDALTEEYEELAAQEGKKGCVLLHESFAYLAEAYGFPVLESVDVEKDSGFSAKEIRMLIDEVAEAGAGMILSDSQYSGRISELLARETGMETYQLDAGVSGDYEKDAWIECMRKNLEELKNAAD